MNLRGITLGSALLLTATAVFYAQQKVLPPPYATPSANNRPKVIPQPAGAKLNVPKGFQVEIYQEGFKVPRFMMLGPSNEILLSDSARGTEGTVYVLQGQGTQEPHPRTGPALRPRHPEWLSLRRRTRIHQAV